MAEPRFLIDACVGQQTTGVLRGMGFDVTSVRELQHDLEDSAVLAMAEDEGRVLVTTDTDFGDIVFLHGHPHAGVLLIRMGNSSGQERAEAVSMVAGARGEELPGAFSVFDGKNLRIRWRNGAV